MARLAVSAGPGQLLLLGIAPARPRRRVSRLHRPDRPCHTPARAVGRRRTWPAARLITVLARAAVAHYNAQRTETSRRVLHDLDAALDTTTLHPDALLNATAALPYPAHVFAALALRLTRDLTQAERDLAAHEPDLASSLSNLGSHLAEAGRRAEALEAAEEAVEIRRRLADPATGNPTAYEPDLASSLTVWAWVLLNTQQDLSSALRATSEAAEIYRKVIAVMADRFLSPLRVVLNLQAEVLLSLGRVQDAKTIRDWLVANPD